MSAFSHDARYAVKVPTIPSIIVRVKILGVARRAPTAALDIFAAACRLNEQTFATQQNISLFFLNSTLSKIKKANCLFDKLFVFFLDTSIRIAISIKDFFIILGNYGHYPYMHAHCTLHFYSTKISCTCYKGALNFASLTFEVAAAKVK